MNTDQVVLRKLREEDAQDLAHLANNKKIADNLRNVFPHPYTLEDAIWFINYDGTEAKDHRWAIEYENKFTGLIGLHVKDDVYAHNLEIGYWLGEQYWGKGIMSAAIAKAVKIGFSELNCHRIYAGVFSYNIGSMRALEKNGFIQEGILKESIYKNGKYHNEHKYGLVRPK